MKPILGIDIGYAHVKCTLMEKDGSILQQFKFPSVIGITKKNEHIQDKRIYDFKENSYNVGENALHLPSDQIVDITSYTNLEYFSALFLWHALQIMDLTEDEMPETVVTGLSVAQLENSGYFKSVLENIEVQGVKQSFNVFVLPQGSGSKITLDTYGNDFPNKQINFTGDQTYVGIDVGGNTLDMFLVTDGRTSPSLFEGIENQGIVRICAEIAKEVKSKFNRGISIQEAREVLDTNAYALRGVKHDFTEFNKTTKKVYLKNLLDLVETKYGKILDKCDFVSLSGGGAGIFNGTEDGFIKVPKNKPEYYNSIGFAIWGTKR